MTELEEIKAAMATRDLMSATLSLSEMPREQVRQEYEVIELVHVRLGRLLADMKASA